MRRGSIGVRTSAGTAAAAALEIIAPAAVGCYLRELEVSLAAATASIYGLGRPAALGVTPTTPVSLLSDAKASAVMYKTATALAWGTGPTVPAAFIRRVSFAAVIGERIKWEFGQGLYIPAGASLVLWNIGTNGVVDVNVVVDED